LVAFDDPCLPLPPLLSDPRRVVLEEVLSGLRAAGVRDQDVTLLCANGLHRKWTAAELLPLVGPAVYARHRHRLACYDAEDAEANVSLGSTASGLLVEGSRHLAEADLVVYVAVPWTEMNGGHKSLACGLATYRCIRQHHRPAVQAGSPLMEPARSAMHRALGEIGRHIGSRVPVLQIETVVNNRLWVGPLRLLDLGRRRLPLALRPAQRLPGSMRSALGRALRSGYQPAGVWAGAVEPVHERALERLARGRAVLPEPADILVLGLPDHSPYSVHSRMNPLLTANLGLGYAFQFGRGAPLVRPGGTLILAGPCTGGFHRRHHRAYQRFWDEVLPVTREAARMEAEFEPAFVADPALLAAYRSDYAYHPAHPFFAWYWMTRALAHVGRVVIAGAADHEVVRRLGFEAAPDVAAAVARERAARGSDATVVVHGIPPVFLVDVGGYPAAVEAAGLQGPAAL